MAKKKKERRAIQVLKECKDLMRIMREAYNRVPQAEYFPHGILSIWTLMHQKMTRIKSLMDYEGENQFESTQDSARDLINCSAFLMSLWRENGRPSRLRKLSSKDVMQRVFLSDIGRL